MDVSQRYLNLGMGECPAHAPEKLKYYKEDLNKTFVKEILSILNKLERHNKALYELEDLNKQLQDDIIYFNNLLVSKE